MRYYFVIIFITMFVLAGDLVAFAEDNNLPYPVVDTAQKRCFTDRHEIAYPASDKEYAGQDAQYRGLVPSYRDNGDGTVSDLNTGLMWVKTPDFKNKSTYVGAVSGAAKCSTGGYTDWRLPTIKELYSLINFNGYSYRTSDQSVPYIETKYFDFIYGDAAGDARLIDAQYWSSTEYTGTTMNGNSTVFGVNFADGRIKGYPAHDQRGRQMKQFVRYVRGNPQYGKNDFVDNGDDTIADRATGLVWMKNDSGKAMNWQQALKYAQELKLAGHDDWRLPNAKELQSIVDYTHSPVAEKSSQRGAAIDRIFSITDKQSWFWTSTTHLENRSCGYAVYICFGQAWGHMHGRKMDVHGAGAQRSDPKSGDPDKWTGGHGPQGDDIRIYNYVRCVRGGVAVPEKQGPAVSGKFDISGNGLAGGGGTPAGGFVGRLDKDSDGKVSKNEFDGPKDHFRVLDRNHDGYLSEDEAPKGPPSKHGKPPTNK